MPMGVCKSPHGHMDLGDGGALLDRDRVTSVRQSSALAAIPSVVVRGCPDHASAAHHIGTRNGVLVSNAPGSDFCAASVRPLSDPSVDHRGDAVGGSWSRLSARRIAGLVGTLRPSTRACPRLAATCCTTRFPRKSTAGRTTWLQSMTRGMRGKTLHGTPPFALVHRGPDDRAAVHSQQDERRDALRCLSCPGLFTPEARRTPPCFTMNLMSSHSWFTAFERARPARARPRDAAPHNIPDL